MLDVGTRCFNKVKCQYLKLVFLMRQAVLMKWKCLSAYHGCLVSIESFHGRIVVPQLMHSHMRTMKLQLASIGMELLIRPVGSPFSIAKANVT